MHALRIYLLNIPLNRAEPGTTVPPLQIDKRLVALVVVAIAIAITSSYLHHPSTPKLFDIWGLKYSDIVYGVFYSIFGTETLSSYQKVSERWFHPEVLERLASGTKLCPLPYVDYKFEYPPLVGALWGLTSCIAIHLVFPEHYTRLDYPELIDQAATLHFELQTAILGVSLVFLAYTLYRIAELAEVSWRRVLLFLILPSTVIYLAYNWDILAATLMVGGLYAFLKKKYAMSGVLFGLAIDAKLLPVAPALILLYELIQRKPRDEENEPLVNYTTSLAITALAPFALLILLAPHGFSAMIQHHASWYCENCIYMLISPEDLWSPIHRIMAMVLIPLSLLLLATRPLDTPRATLTVSAAAITGTILFNYVFTPQMMLMISPLLVLTVPTDIDLSAIVIADIANAATILLFFEDSYLRSVLAPILGIGTQYNPWTLDSPTQWAAQLRNILLLIIWIILVATALSSKRKPGPFPEST